MFVCVRNSRLVGWSGCAWIPCDSSSSSFSVKHEHPPGQVSLGLPLDARHRSPYRRHSSPSHFTLDSHNNRPIGHNSSMPSEQTNKQATILGSALPAVTRLRSVRACHSESPVDRALDRLRIHLGVHGNDCIRVVDTSIVVSGKMDVFRVTRIDHPFILCSLRSLPSVHCSLSILVPSLIMTIRALRRPPSTSTCAQCGCVQCKASTFIREQNSTVKASGLLVLLAW